MKLVISAILALWLCFPYLANAYTKDDTAKTAASDGSLSDTQNALSYINGRNEDGWTLTVGAPGNTYNWSSTLQIPAGHTITVQGAGTYSPDTRPTVNFTHSQGSAISFSATNGKVVRITNFKFTDSGSPIATIQVNGGSNLPSWRIDHIRFENIADRAIKVLDANQSGAGIGPYGLVDNCWFESMGSAYHGLYVYSANSSNSWTTPMSFGTDKTVVIEDCVFNRTGATVEGEPALDSAYNGARWMIRHSTFNNWVVVLHGADSAPTSNLQFEFNHNIMRVNDAVDYALYIRGGTGVAMGNDIGGIGGNAWYNNAWKMVRDGPCSSGYPCFQQVGRGVVNNAEGSVPVYFWNNTIDGSVDVEAGTEGSSDIRLNRDFFVGTPKPGYTELAYPHPLRSTPTGGNPPPAPPKNLRIL